MLFALMDAVRMTDECGISDPFLGTVDILGIQDKQKDYSKG